MVRGIILPMILPMGSSSLFILFLKLCVNKHTPKRLDDTGGFGISFPVFACIVPWEEVNKTPKISSPSKINNSENKHIPQVAEGTDENNSWWTGNSEKRNAFWVAVARDPHQTVYTFLRYAQEQGSHSEVASMECFVVRILHPPYRFCFCFLFAITTIDNI
uniref:Uncharacterized protein n=1 Tax=Anopheles culicifacies TaxID=139723 RepID=A0A182M169_9DIPT